MTYFLIGPYDDRGTECILNAPGTPALNETAVKLYNFIVMLGRTHTDFHLEPFYKSDPAFKDQIEYVISIQARYQDGQMSTQHMRLFVKRLIIQVRLRKKYSDVSSSYFVIISYIMMSLRTIYFRINL